MDFKVGTKVTWKVEDNGKISEEIMAAIEKEMPYMVQVGPGLWKISTGGPQAMIVFTGDSGAQAFREEMRKSVSNGL